MGRWTKGVSYAHHIQRIGPDHYRLSWAYDRFIKGSRLRFPQTTQRDTDFAGAKRFAGRWGLEEPVQ